MTQICWLTSVGDESTAHALARLRDHVDAAGWRDQSTPTPDVVIVWADTALDDAQRSTLARAASAGAVLVLAGPTLTAADPEGELAERAGLLVGTTTPAHDVRVRPGRDRIGPPMGDHGHGGPGHLGDHEHVHDRVLAVEKATDDVEVLLTAHVGLAEHPVATWRPSTRVLAWTLGTTPQSLDSRTTTRLLLLAIRHALALAPPAPVRVGLLGYGAIGHEHARAASAVPGLELGAVCDASPTRLDAARSFSPWIRTHTDAEDLLADDGLDLLVVSTPPSTHASWGLRAVRAGRHVVLEKPFALTTCEADAVLAAAAKSDLLAVVYQNRRFDPDHQALQRLVARGALGEVFHLEAFVGGYGHPCNLWHSDEAVSGGAIYDWGAHVIDQLLDLVPARVVSVSAVTHKRKWFDVTNADHSRVTISFDGGAEAHFVYSDLAAALKPRWYVLGTEGAVVGQWRTERVVSRSDVGTLAEDVLQPADSPPLMEQHHPDGSVTHLGTPAGAPHAFHTELADHLRLGLPMSVTGEQSRRVLAVMEAARASAADGGRGVQPR